MLIYFMKVKTEAGWRYIGDPSKGRVTTLHPSVAQRLDMNEPLPESVSQLIDKCGTGEMMIVKEAACLHPNCDCTWESKGPNLSARWAK